MFHLDLHIYQLPENGHPEPEPFFPFFHEPQSAGSQFALFLLEVAAGFTAAFFEAQQLFASPAAAGFAFALLAQQLFAFPAAAGFAFAAAIGQAGVPASGQSASALLHFAGSQFVASQLLRSHCALVAAALIFSVLVQPLDPHAQITRMPKIASIPRLCVSTFFILFLQKDSEGYKLG